MGWGAAHRCQLSVRKCHWLTIILHPHTVIIGTTCTLFFKRGENVVCKKNIENQETGKAPAFITNQSAEKELKMNQLNP